uniref:ACH10 protein n=1 Tax=Denticeps clupeoides TaxID=299321 RepID=A0AAY4CWI9_9TELE
QIWSYADGTAPCLAADGQLAYKLMKDLFSNYSSALRPVQDTEDIINVTLQITLSQIIDMDERNQILTSYLWVRQVWVDAYLSWDQAEYDGLDTIRIPSSYVWRPDIVLYNNADDQFSSSLETNVVIRHDGQVTWDQPSITKSSCRVDVSFFPFDSQQCHLTFGSWTHNGNQMDLFNTLDSADLTDFVENVEWEVLGMPAKKSMILYGCCSDPYPDITYTLHLKRRASFYIFNLLIPCMLISFLAPLSFYLPAESGEKVSLGVTVLLALTVFQLLVAESMPPSENVPLIGKYYIATMTMITMSTAVTIFVMNIHHCGPEARPVPTWVRRLVLHYLARICFVYEKGERCMGIQPEKAETPPTAKEVGGGQKDTNHLDPGPETGSEPLLLPSPPPRAAGCHREGTAVWAEPEAGPKGEGGVIGDMGWGQGVSHLLLRQIEFIAKCYHDQRSTQQRTGEWRKVAKVMDSFFMWLFFIMVFLLSLLIIGKAI